MRAGVTRDPGSARPCRRCFRLSPGWPALAAALLALPWLTACGDDLTLVDPAPLFRFDTANTWPLCSGVKPGDTGGDTKGDTGGDNATEAGAPVEPPTVPPPPGLSISACPNPAPPGTPTITIQFRLDVRVPNVNLAIVSSDGQIVRVLLDHRVIGIDEVTRVPWPLDGVDPGDYRAYFLAGRLETSGDLKVE